MMRKLILICKINGVSLYVRLRMIHSINNSTLTCTYSFCFTNLNIICCVTHPSSWQWAALLRNSWPALSVIPTALSCEGLQEKGGGQNKQSEPANKVSDNSLQMQGKKKQRRYSLLLLKTICSSHGCTGIPPEWQNILTLCSSKQHFVSQMLSTEQRVKLAAQGRISLTLFFLPTKFNLTQFFECEHKVTLTHIRHSETHCAWIGLLFG